MKTNCRFINNHLARCLHRVLAPGRGGIAILLMAALWLLGAGSAAEAAGTFSPTGNLIDGRYDHTATLLTNGKVLVVGGTSGTKTELYDPATGQWSATGNLAKQRFAHSATLLPNGNVLVVGGNSSLSSAEIYDATSGTWTETGSLTIGRNDHTATLLANGKVLVAGGSSAGGLSASAELYDPATGKWTTQGGLINARSFHTATLLPNGKVLVAGGYGTASRLASAELYNPASGTWVTTGSFNSARTGHTSTLLPNGKVLLAGGGDSFGYFASASLYDPATGMWSPTGSITLTRASHSATLLPNGTVLITGGSNFNGAVKSADLYDPVNATWAATGSLSLAHVDHTATLLANGKVLVAGSSTISGGASAELYESATGSWAAANPLATARHGHTSTLLPNGKVLVTGGYSGLTYLASAELHNPATGTWTTTGNLTAAHAFHRATLLPNGLVLVAGGFAGSSYLASAELYNPATGTWATTGNLTTARTDFTATLLPNGRVLVVGGIKDNTQLSSAELYNPATGTWSPTASLASARVSHTTTLLPNGKVLVVGGNGLGAAGALASAELYDPTNGTWTATGSLTTKRVNHTATLLPNGKVLVAGGFNGNYLSSAELYNPATGMWTATGSLSSPHSFSTATLLPNGKVLLVAGYNGLYLASAELYDPELGSWTATGNLATARYFHTATLLPNGKVLVTGGSNDSNLLASAELYDVGLGVAMSRQPQIGGAFVDGSHRLVLTGTGFAGGSEGSGGNSNNSASNVPVVQVRSLANEQSVFLGSSAATNWSATSFTTGSLLAMPDGYASVTVFTNGIPSASTIFSTILPTGPSVFSISPNTGGSAGGTSVTITGANFTGATSVTFGGADATSFNVVNATTITCTTPTGAAGSASVIVIAPVGSSSANSLFTYVAPPTLTVVVPDSGTAAGGTSVTLFGASFTGATGVTIGGTAATNVVVVNDATISCTTPAGAAGTANVAVTNPAGANAANTLYTYIATPIVDEISPVTGTADGGTVVTITGTNFTGTTGVTIGGTAATNVNIINATTITCTTPAGAEGVASVIVANVAGANAANALYTYASPTGIAVKGNALNIPLGDTTPGATDGSDFGVVPVLSALLPHSFAVVNVGGLPLHLIGSSTVSITGPAADDFEVVTLPSTTVSVGRSNPFAISFQPTAPGLRTATVTIASDAPATPSFTFAIAGYGTLAKNFVNAIAFTPPATLYLGQSPFTLSASASSNLPVTLNLVPPFPAGTTLVGDVLTVTTAGIVKVQATCAASGIFNAAVPVLKTITVKANPSTLTLINLAQVYDGNPKPVATLGGAATITYKVGPGFVATPPTAAGSYPVKAVGATTVTGILVIAKAPLVVTADNKFKLAGRANPALTASYSGFLNADSLSNITAPVLKTTAALTSPTGTYPIIARGGAAANYRFVLLPGTLAVGSFAGSYEALLVDGNSSPSGKLSITVAANATNSFTGKLAVGAEVTPLPITGTLNTNADTQHATSDVYRINSNGIPYAISIDLSVFGSAPMSVTVLSDNQLLGSTTRGRKLSKATVLYAGAHTAVFEPAAPGGSGTPRGSGWATANISSTGVLTLSGRLGDDTAFTAALSPDREIKPGYRLFAQPYLAARTQSFIAGDFALAPYPGLANRLYLAQKFLTWQKVGRPTDTSYRAGFGPVTTVLMIDPWLPPVAGTSLAQRLGMTGNSFGITTSDPGSASGVNLPTRLSLSATNKVSVLTPLANLTKWKTLTFKPATGTFTGSFELVDGLMKRTPTFSGILRQPASGADILIGDGHYLLAPLSGTEKTTGEVMFTRP